MVTQVERRTRSRAALLEAAARGISRHGYANLRLDQVAAEAGYTRGALYHLFSGKDDLALAVVAWVDETWTAEVGQPAVDRPDPVDSLLTMARGHAVYCRRDVARVMRNLAVESLGPDHPVGQSVEKVFERLLAVVAGLITAGRRSGALPAGPPVQVTALAYLAALEGVATSTAGHRPHDVELVERAARGVLGLPLQPPAPATRASRRPTRAPTKGTP